MLSSPLAVFRLAQEIINIFDGAMDDDTGDFVKFEHGFGSFSSF
jgi:hypothetical protein